MASSSRSRVPEGFVGFRPDLGTFLKDRRKALGKMQKALAHEIGIARPSLSAIENGHAWPLPDTLEGLMRELELDWPMILVRGKTDRTARSTDETPRANQRQELGRYLREGRRKERLALWQVAERCGMSVAQLSRIERGEARHSRAYEDHPEDLMLPPDYRIIRFRHDELQRLYELTD